MRVVSDGILRRVNVEPRIRIMIATGSHRAPTDREIDTLVGEELHRRASGSAGSTTRGTVTAAGTW